jgi:hypothetical protein
MRFTAFPAAAADADHFQNGLHFQQFILPMSRAFLCHDESPETMGLAIAVQPALNGSNDLFP